MKLVSIRQTAQRAVETARRFPLPLLLCLIVAGAGLRLIDEAKSQLVQRLFVVALAGIPLTVALTLRWADAPTARRRAVVAALTFLGISLWWTAGWAPPRLLVWYAQFSVGFHCLVALVPLGRADRAGFWRFNWKLLERWVLGGLLAVVLFGGLALALVACDKLLAIDVPERTFPRLWMLVTFVFHPWFVLSGAPSSIAELREDEYPGAVRILAQFILVPLVAIYLVILTLYLGRVVVTGVWPSGWIGNLVASVSVAGTLVLVLADPLRDRAQGAWIQRYSRLFFIALLPSLVMAFLAIGKRISQYGVTEPRYFYTVLVFWMAGIAVWFIVSRARSIATIPASLGIVALVTGFGPWGTASVSRRSQVHRFERALAAAKAGGDSAARARDQAADIARYLVERNEPAALARAVGAPPDSTRVWLTLSTSDHVQRALALGGLSWAGSPGGFGLRVVTFRARDPVGRAGVDLPRPGILFLSPRLFEPATLVIDDGDTVRVRPHREAGFVEVEVAGFPPAHLAVGDSLRRLVADSTAHYGTIERDGPIVVATKLGRLTIRLVIGVAHWPLTPSDSGSRSIQGAIVLERD